MRALAETSDYGVSSLVEMTFLGSRPADEVPWNLRSWQERATSRAPWSGFASERGSRRGSQQEALTVWAALLGLQERGTEAAVAAVPAPEARQGVVGFATLPLPATG